MCSRSLLLLALGVGPSATLACGPVCGLITGDRWFLLETCRRLVGWQGDPAIDRAIFPLIHKFSEGIPRRINLICSRLFLLGSVEERHGIEVKDLAVVIRELQNEGLAAGAEFSPDDFEALAEVEWVAVPVGVSQEQPEIDVQTANDEHHVQEELESGAVEEEKDSSTIDEAPQPTPPESPASPDVAAVDVVEPQGDPGGDSTPDDSTIAPVSQRVDPGMKEGLPASEVWHRDNPRAIWQSVSSLGVIVALIGCLVFFLKDALPPEYLEKFAEVAGVNQPVMPAPDAYRASMTTEVTQAGSASGVTMASTPRRLLVLDEELRNWIDAVLDDIFSEGEGLLFAQFDIPEESGQAFSVSFSPDSDVPEPD